MTNLKKFLSIVAVVSALGASALATAPSSAHGFEHFHGFHHFHHWHHHWHSHWGFHWRSHWRFHPIHRHVWGYRYHFEGYRHVGVASAPRVCQPGFHLGYLGKFCWPNR